MNHLKPTNELDAVLKKAELNENLKDYFDEEDLLAENLPFSLCFRQLDKVKNALPAEIVRQSGLDRTYAYQILEGKRNPSRDKEIALCIAAGLDEQEISRILKMTGYSPLYARKKRDAVLIFALHQGMNVLETNELLDEYQEKLLQ